MTDRKQSLKALTLNMPVDDLEKLRATAKAHDQTVTRLVRRAIKTELERMQRLER